MALAAALDEPAASEAELERWVAAARGFSCEFPLFLANHLPMVLVALQRMGASERRLGDYFALYRDTNHLAPMPAPVAPIVWEGWTEALGERAREADYRAFFAGEVARLGARRAVADYLPTLLPGMGASATHALMRLAYGWLRGDEAEIGVALGYWAATYLELGRPGVAAADTDDPAEVLLRLKPVACFHGIETELDLLWHHMRAMATHPEFAPVIDWLRIGPDGLERVARASLALFAGTMDFCALHAVTGAHWLRILWPVLPDPALALRYFWQIIAALYPKIGFPELPDAAQLEEWRRAPCPDWPAIRAKAIQSADEHDLSLAFSAWEEWKVYGDPLYRFVAARRVGLIA